MRRRRRDLMEAFSRLSLRMQEALTLEQELACILEEVHEVLTLDRFNILIADEAEGVLRSMAGWGNLEEPLERIWVPIDARGGGLAKAYRERVEVIFKGEGPLPDELRLAYPFSEIKAFRSRQFAIFPLVCREKVIGVLGADNKFSRRPLSPSELNTLRIFAAHAATAIANARLFQETQEGLTREHALVQEIKRVGSVAAELTSDLGLSTILDHIVRAVAEACGSQMSSVLLVDEQKQELVHGAAVGLPDEYVQAIARFPIGPNAACCGTAAYRNEVVIVEDTRTDPLTIPYLDLLEPYGLRAIWSVPLRDKRGRVLGTFATYYSEPHRPMQDQVEIAELYARHAAIAIENARLFQEME
ncbi:MAG: GAF domain-containing protein, partial [Candidatus Methylomirabilales bacterium]